MADAVKKVTKLSGISLLSDMFTSPDVPELAEPTVMPIADEQALAAARRRQAGRKGSGRASTVLTGGKKLGTGGGRTTLGG